MKAGDTRKFTASVSPSNAANKTVTWMSSDESVASVSLDGTVTAIGGGTVYIYAYASDGGGAQGYATVTVTAAVTGVSVSPDIYTLEVGGSVSLFASISPPNATNQAVTWLSSNSRVASVDQYGNVTARAPGSVTITVTTIDGRKQAYCDITVVNPSPPSPDPSFEPHDVETTSEIPPA
jgi:uncharacterized protein YjdB